MMFQERGIDARNLDFNLTQQVKSDYQEKTTFWDPYSRWVADRLWVPPTDTPNGEFRLPAQAVSKWKVNLDVPTTDQTYYAARKIRFYPSNGQRAFLERMFGAHRYFYNEAVIQGLGAIGTDPIRLREVVVKRHRDLTDREKWQADIPFDVKALAVKAYTAARKAADTNLRRGNIKSFGMKPLDKKDNRQVAYFPQSAIKDDYRLYPTYFGETRAQQNRYSKLIFRTKGYRELGKIGGITHDFQILRDGPRYYLVTMIEKSVIVKGPANSVITAIDPGFRTFATCYGPDHCAKIGTGLTTVVDRINGKIDKLTASISNTPRGKKQDAMRQRLIKLRTKERGVVNNFQWQTASRLINESSVVLLPEFRTQGMAKHSNNPHLNRWISSFAHYRFKQKMLHKASTYADRKVIICREHWTSKTCSRCGWVNHELKDAKTFRCAKCPSVIDRDINAARNILIRSVRYGIFPSRFDTPDPSLNGRRAK